MVNSILYKIVKQTNETNKSEVPKAAGGEAERLGTEAHVAVPTIEAQVPANRGIVGRTTTVGAS